MTPIQRKLLSLTADDLVKVYKTAFRTPEGQLVLEDLKRRCFVNKTTVGDENGKPTEWNEGMRAVYLHIETLIELEEIDYENDE